MHVPKDQTPMRYVLASCVTILILSGCASNLRPETRKLAQEVSDSTAALMRVSNDSEFFRQYIAFNVRFTLRHKLALNDTAIARELQDEIAKTALVQEAQKRVNAIQNAIQ
jgi:outer membrane murein-binding lipoprotein Lpp